MTTVRESPSGPLVPIAAGGLTNLSNVRYADVGTSVLPIDQDGNIETPFDTLGAAVAACPAGGCVMVCPGDYTGESDVPLDKDITIRGLGAVTSGDTTLNAQMPTLLVRSGTNIHQFENLYITDYDSNRPGSVNALSCLLIASNAACTSDFFFTGTNPSHVFQTAGGSLCQLSHAAVFNVTAGFCGMDDCLLFGIVNASASASLRQGSGSTPGASITTPHLHWDVQSKFFSSTLDTSGCALITIDGALAGPQGAQGTEGAAGLVIASAGPQGTQTIVSDGLQGWQLGAVGSGSQGPQGPQGAQGAGTQGAQGAQGTQGSSGGPQGPQGAQGTQGSSGGPQGTQGAQGAQGAQGTAGMVITPLSLLLVVDPAATGSLNGAFSGNKAFSTITDAVAAVVTAAPDSTAVIYILPGNYSGEGSIAWSDFPIVFVGVSGFPSDVTIDALAPAVLMAASGIQTKVNPSSAVNVNLFNCTGSAEGTSGSTYKVSGPLSVFHGSGDAIGQIQILSGCEVDDVLEALGSITLDEAKLDGVAITGAGINIRRTIFAGTCTLAGSVNIDAESFLSGVSTGSVFPGTTNVQGLPSKTVGVGVVSVPDDDAYHLLATVDFAYAGVILGFSASAFAGFQLSPSGPFTPTGSIKIIDPAANEYLQPFEVTNSGVTTYFPFSTQSAPSEGSGTWQLLVKIDNGTGASTAAHISLQIAQGY